MDHLSTEDVIARLAPFGDLEPGVVRALASISHVRRYPHGTLILLEGDAKGPVYFVSRGAVRVFSANLEGREQTLTYLHPGEALNLPGAFAQQWELPASAEAVGEVELVSMAPSDLQRVVMAWPALGLRLLAILSERTRHLAAVAFDLSLLSVRARIARFLLAERHARSDPPVRWTHAQIAARVGTVRVVVSRTLSALAAEGVIRVERQRIEIVNSEALERMAQG